MAIMQMNVFSKELQRTVNVSVIIPGDTAQVQQQPYQSLYLLHGILGSELDWLTGTRIRRYAEEKNIAIFMPAGENSSYLNYEQRSANYTRFVGEELVDITRQMFNLSKERKDTYIAGLSMGGYGALVVGLTYHQTFSQIGALSAALMNNRTDFAEEDSQAPFFFKQKFFEATFDNQKQEKVDPLIMVENLVRSKRNLPYIYIACGKADFVLADNHKLEAHLHKLGVDHLYVEDEGGHDWDFWDKYIKLYLDFLSSEKNQVIDSGNVQ